ncbi:hypothetical protein BDK51DRAFT_51622 [Blyttiomyces helicus]|uniref:PNPLA domain-containing protein n=1 Tax=Blyttiomyces helicus TaxID=388810 RepID=A0A4P9WBN3_9FUNG|nr:hypothetical protein BDK51DRAFT_51622 [Blyttiomyces helicus]|eukprot:RKO89015.1 hypothetical protein BDK51DRAFT_51622 [Blyttiomyces helicus]
MSNAAVNAEEFFEEYLECAVFFAPASGPRSLVTLGFDRRLKHLVQSDALTSKKWLVGSSTGALRFAALLGSLVTGENLTRELKNQYCRMHYKDGVSSGEEHRVVGCHANGAIPFSPCRKDTPATLAPMMRRMYNICAPASHLDEILAHPHARLAFIVSRVKSPFDRLPDWQLRIVFAIFAFFSLFFNVAPLLLSRIVFYSGDEVPKFLENGVGGSGNVEFVSLVKDNIYEVLHATTCVPFIQERCEYITGIGPGLFIDGAMTDYQLNTKMPSTLPSLLLSDMDHPAVYQTALDALIGLRSAPSALFEHASYVHADPSFSASLPEKKAPSMCDFFARDYIDDPGRRRRNWNAAFALSERAFPSCLWSALCHTDQGTRVDTDAVGLRTKAHGLPLYAEPTSGGIGLAAIWGWALRRARHAKASLALP